MEKDEITIRKASAEDIPRLMEIFAYARRFMAESGNPAQWTDGYPDRELIADDIRSGDCHAVVRCGRIVATFVLRGGDDPTYSIIDGAWPDDAPYTTIHRIASCGEVKGIMHIALQFALEQYHNIRIDTHRDNIVMQKALAAEGFRYCGIIRCWNGSERLAYQYTE